MSFIEIICLELIILCQSIKKYCIKDKWQSDFIENHSGNGLNKQWFNGKICTDMIIQRIIFVWCFHKIVWIWKMNCNCCIINYRAKTISISTIQLLLLSIVLSFLPIKWQMVTSLININYSLVCLIPIACVFGTFHL